MIVYTIRRLLMLIPILLGVTFLTFAIAQVTPGDPVVLMLGQYATPERVEELREELGYNDPFLVQFGNYVWNAMRGDLGKSIRGQTPVLDEILARFPSTLQLTVSAMLIAIVFGVGGGVIAAMSKNKFVENGIMVVALAGLSIPDFWLAIILIIIFGVNLHWVSVTGGSGIKDLILPAFTLALAPTAMLARLTRSSILEVVREDYVRTARAKGLNWRKVTQIHVLKNSLIPVVTVIGMTFAGLLGGAVFIENVFARPGLGRFAVNAIAARDYPQVQGVVLFTATIFVLLNLAVDLLYGWLDPRIRYD
ncbi:MAG: ABC transporter permease [Chloroflexi bacterium]|nr:MAG: ABC transporter permease [Chloroflexota bacterium]